MVGWLFFASPQAGYSWLAPFVFGGKLRQRRACGPGETRVAWSMAIQICYAWVVILCGCGCGSRASFVLRHGVVLCSLGVFVLYGVVFFRPITKTKTKNSTYVFMLIGVCSPPVPVLVLWCISCFQVHHPKNN